MSDASDSWLGQAEPELIPGPAQAGDGVRDDLAGGVYTTDAEGRENGRLGSPQPNAQSLGLARNSSRLRPSLKVMTTPGVVDERFVTPH